jgi:hypothetical protein
VRPRGATYPDRTHQADVHQSAKLVGGIPGERTGEAVAGVVDDDIDTAERVERALHRGGGAVLLADVVRIRHCFAAGALDFIGHVSGGKIRCSRAVERRANVVDHNARPAPREQMRIGAAQTVAGAGYNRHAAIETHLIHWLRPSLPGAQLLCRSRDRNGNGAGAIVRRCGV